jgi:mannose-6-phosphate isomerase
MTILYPLMFKPYLKEVMWGGRKLAIALNKQLPKGKKIGESWEIDDANVITNGHLGGQTLNDILRHFGPLLVGTRTENLQRFPFILKLSSAELDLSIQVHPDDEYARNYELESGYTGKMEMIYVISTKPGARIFLGFNRPVDRLEFEKLMSESPESILNVLQQIKVSDGDVIFVPPGTIHAYGAGIVYFELQQNSDITYRLYDWGRLDAAGKPRELHIQNALKVINYKHVNPPKVRPLYIREKYGDRYMLTLCAKFAVERIVLTDQLSDGCFGATFHVLCILNGEATLQSENSQEILLKKGDVVLIPACINRYTLLPNKTDCQLLRSYVPDLENMKKELKKLGISENDINALGVNYSL